MMQILDTTDGKYIGHEFDENDLPIKLENVQFAPEEVVLLPDGTYQLSNSSYIIYAKKVK